jgi:hypothetical protein
MGGLARKAHEWGIWKDRHLQDTQADRERLIREKEGLREQPPSLGRERDATEQDGRSGSRPYGAGLSRELAERQRHAQLAREISLERIEAERQERQARGRGRTQSMGIDT